MNREDILRSDETAKLVNEFIGKSPIQPTYITWQQFVEHKLNDGKFKTEDGVVVDSSEFVYGIESQDLSLLYTQPARLTKEFSQSILWFSSNSARQTWIEQNAPKLSYNDVIELCKIYFADFMIAAIEKPFQDLVKSKMK